MKRAALALALAACGTDGLQRPDPPPVQWSSLDPRPPPDAASASATNQERAIPELYMKALGDGDPLELGRVLGDEAHFTLAGQVTAGAIGRRDIIAAHDQLFSRYQPRVFTATRVLRTDRAQAIEWTMTGRDKASDKPVGIRGIALIGTRDDGTIEDLGLYFDEAVVDAQLGAGLKELQALPIPIAPTATPEVVDQARTPAETASVAVVGKWLDALEANEAAYAGAATDDVAVITLHDAAPSTGKHGLQSYYEHVHRAIEQVDTQLDGAWAAGPYVVAEYHIVGMQRGKYLYVPMKDPVIKVSIVDVVELRAGKIARVWRYDNPIQIVQPQGTP
jgi:hypothetical protein